ncbi:MAG TPA: enoyl-CoA hydratase-related protein [Acidimicrobiales bacterium]|nr:enoyl-CoA hydratase-related protein [Acidimicrobiales bacterium]
MGAITIDAADGIATVTLDRPPVNAVDRPTLADIAEAFTSLADRRDVRAAIFTAAGTRAFMGGADLNDTSPPDPVDPGRVARHAMWAIVDCPVPVIGAVNGPAVGAGLAFAACCDMLIAADHATFSTPEIDVGLLGASAHLSLMVGRHKAREMFFLGERVSADELHRLGSVRKVVPSDELMPAARDLARQLAAKSPLALRLAKESMNRTEGLPLKEAYRTEQDYTARLLTTEDSREARQAYLEKRDPVWKWR